MWGCWMIECRSYNRVGMLIYEDLSCIRPSGGGSFSSSTSTDWDKWIGAMCGRVREEGDSVEIIAITVEVMIVYL